MIKIKIDFKFNLLYCKKKNKNICLKEKLFYQNNKI